MRNQPRKTRTLITGLQFHRTVALSAAVAAAVVVAGCTSAEPTGNGTGPGSAPSIAAPAALASGSYPTVRLSPAAAPSPVFTKSAPVKTAPGGSRTSITTGGLASYAPQASSVQDIESTVTAPTAPSATPSTPNNATAEGSAAVGSAVEPSGTVPTTFPRQTVTGSGRTLIHPRYDLSRIDRSDPIQVAWAYLTLRLSYSYTDRAAGAGVARSAVYATPTLQNRLHTQAAAADQNGWKTAAAQKRAAAITVDQFDSFPAAATDTIAASWTLTITSTAGDHTVPGQTTSLVLRQQPNGTWLVDNDGFGTAN